MASRAAKPCKVCGKLLSNPFNLRRHLNCRHGIKELSDTALLKHAAQQWMDGTSSKDDSPTDMTDSPISLSSQQLPDQRIYFQPGAGCQNMSMAMSGGGYGDYQRRMSDLQGHGSADGDKSSTTSEDSTGDDGDDESDEDYDDPMDSKDPVGSWSSADTDPFKFIRGYMKRDMKNDGNEGSPSDVNKLFRDYYRYFVLFCRNLRRNKDHKMIMATVNDLMNRNEREKYSFEEALKEGIRQRKFILDGLFPDDSDSKSDEEEVMD